MSTPHPLKLGFIGLGIMGTPMAGHLLKAGHQLFVHSVPSIPADVLAAGATGCSSGREVAQKADIIFVMVPDTPHVADVLFSENGVAAGLSKGKTVVDMSSISPIETKAFAKKINALNALAISNLRRTAGSPSRGGSASALAIAASPILRPCV